MDDFRVHVIKKSTCSVNYNKCVMINLENK